MNRRDLLRVLASAAVLPLAESLPRDLYLWGREVHQTVGDGPGGAFRSLDAAAARLLAAACERIIPADDTPGARAAGVPAFIDRVLSGWCTADERERFLEGLRAIDVRSGTTYGSPFTELTELRQTAVLEALDAEYTAWRAAAPGLPAAPGVQALPAHGFGMLKVLTIWGYCTSEVGQRSLHLHPAPTTFDGCAASPPREGVAHAANDCAPGGEDPR